MLLYILKYGTIKIYLLSKNIIIIYLGGIKKLKKLILFILSLTTLLYSISINTFANEISENMKAAWITTVYNSDFPSTESYGNPEKQKKEFINIINKLQNIGINTIVVQVRPKSDALYKSSINPWSDVLTGIQGKYPGYDPLEFMIEETHKRGMEFHAWLNPYRVTTSGTDINLLNENHFARLNPQLLIEHKSALYYNPELPEVKEHIKNTVAEIVENYNVDAIHFDDYFYPSNYPLPKGENPDGEIANFRRQNVNEMVKMVYDTIKSINPKVKFGISPMGIWKNKTSDSTGSNTKGQECYYAVFSDVRTWINENIVDYIVPQIYWEIGNKSADYETLVKWWDNEVENSNVKLYIGQALYKDIVSSEIDKQLEINNKYNNVKGSFFFSTKDIINNRNSCSDTLKNFYSNNNETINSTNNNNDNIYNNLLIKTVKSFPTSDTIIVNNKPMIFESYNIDGYNYFKLRDLAFALNNTSNQFDIEWNNDNSEINIIKNKSYIPVGNEMIIGNKNPKIATTSTDKLYINNLPIFIETYKIENSNYYKLRDLAKELNFEVNWNEKGTIYINSK